MTFGNHSPQEDLDLKTRATQRFAGRCQCAVGRHTSIRRTAAWVACLVFVGCQEKLPVAPSELTSGIVVYEHADYLGASAHITTDVTNLEDFKGPCWKGDGRGGIIEVWGDCISSIRLAPGWRATIYEDDSFRGQQLTLTADAPNLAHSPGLCDEGGFNDCVSSIRLIRP